MQLSWQQVAQMHGALEVVGKWQKPKGKKKMGKVFSSWRRYMKVKKLQPTGSRSSSSHRKFCFNSTKAKKKERFINKINDYVISRNASDYTNSKK